MTPQAIYHTTPPDALTERLAITFKLADGYVSYPRQEEPTPDAYAALCAEFHAEVMLYLDQLLRQEERQRRIRALWAQIKDLEAAQQEVAR